MHIRYILSEYIDKALAKAVYDKLDDGTFSGRIPSCKGVIAFGVTLRDCEDELRSTLEDWILVGLKLTNLDLMVHIQDPGISSWFLVRIALQSLQMPITPYHS